MKSTTEHIISDTFKREISFEYFESLYMLVCIPILIILILIYIRWQKKNLLRFSSKNLQESLSDNKSIIRKNIKYILKVLSISFLIIAISNPRIIINNKKNLEETIKGINTNNEEITSKGIEIMIALDVSTSMICEDMNKSNKTTTKSNKYNSRLYRSTQLVLELVNKLSNHKIGLVIFAGKAYTQVPITTDHKFIKKMLKNINTDMIEIQGTNISNAIQKSVENFDFKKNIHKSIIIISDGESHEDETLEIASKLVEEKKIFIQTISVGKEEGGLIPIIDKYDNIISYKKDKDKNVIVTKPNIQFLSLLARTGNGSHFNLNGDENIKEKETKLRNILNQINKIPQEEFIKPINIKNSQMREKENNYKNLYTYFLLISFIIIFLDLLILSTNTGSLNKLIQK